MKMTRNRVFRARGGLRAAALVVGLASSAFGVEYDIANDVVAETVGADVREYLTRRTATGTFTLDGLAPRTIHVGETVFAKTNGLSAVEMKDEEWVVRSVGADIVLNGRGRGLTLAAVHFLEDDCGIRFWSEYEEDVPTGDLVLRSLDRRGRPAFPRRDVYTTPKTRPNMDRFAAMTRLNGRGSVKYGPVFAYGSGGSCHTFARYLPAEKHFKAHPEWFSFSREAGRRVPSEICLTNPEVRGHFKQRLRSLILADRSRCAAAGTPPPVIYDVSQNDTRNHCECPACAAVVGEKGASGLLLDFVNDVAGSVRDEFPDVRVMTFAYLWSAEPPKDGTRAADNVIVRFCNTKSNLAGSVRDADNDWLVQTLAAWKPHADALAVWDYPITYSKGTMGFPVPGEFGFADLLRTYRDFGVVSVYFEHEDQHKSDMWELKYRLETKLMENPDDDAEAIIADFMDRYYGAAGRHVLAARRRLWEARKARGGFVSWIPASDAFDYIGADDLAVCTALFGAAEEAVRGDTVRLARVRRARLGLDLLALSRERLAGRPDSPRARQSLSCLTNDWVNWIGRYEDPSGEWKLVEKAMTVGVAPPPQFRNRRFVDFPTPALRRPSAERGGDATTDPTSAVGYAYRLSYDFARDPKVALPFAAGMTDMQSKRTIVSRSFERPIGPGWNWYCVGRGRPTAKTRLWVTRTWSIFVHGSRYCEIWDKDWEMWVSAKFTGPVFGQPSDDGMSRVWIDRVVLVEPETED